MGAGERRALMLEAEIVSNHWLHLAVLEVLRFVNITINILYKALSPEALHLHSPPLQSVSCNCKSLEGGGSGAGVGHWCINDH